MTRAWSLESGHGTSPRVTSCASPAIPHHRTRNARSVRGVNGLCDNAAPELERCSETRRSRLKSLTTCMNAEYLVTPLIAEPLGSQGGQPHCWPR